VPSGGRSADRGRQGSKSGGIDRLSPGAEAHALRRTSNPTYVWGAESRVAPWWSPLGRRQAALSGDRPAATRSGPPQKNCAVVSSSHGLPSQDFWEDFCPPTTHKLLILLVPGEGLEPPTNGLQNRCSTAELTRQINGLRNGRRPTWQHTWQQTWQQISQRKRHPRRQRGWRFHFGRDTAIASPTRSVDVISTCQIWHSTR
jgi:hypothetical protein